MIKRPFKLLPIVFMLMVPFMASLAQDLKFEKISIDEGLKSSRVVNCLQDQKGYIWFATKNGIDKYNGSSLTHYAMNNNNPFQDNDNMLNCMICSNYYDIICGTLSGKLFCYDRKRDCFNELILTDAPDILFNISALETMDNGDIWLGTPSGLFFYNKERKEIKKSHQGELNIRFIEKDSLGQIWVGTSTGLLKIKDNQQQIQDIITGQDITAIHFCRDLILCGTQDSKILTLSQQNAESQQDNYTQRSFNHNFTVKITKIIGLPSGDIAISLDGMGVYIADKELNIKQHITHNNNDPHSLSSNSVHNIFVSNENILWISTYGGGVNYFNPNKKPFKSIQHQPFLPNSLRNNYVKSIITDKDGNIWIGTKQGISIYNPQDGQWQHIPKLGEANPKMFHVMAMYLGEGHDIWIASYGNGLLKINSATHQIQQFKKEDKNNFRPNSNHLFDVMVDKMGRVWTGGIWGQLAILQEGKRQNLNLGNTRCILEHQDKVYVGTSSGLFIIDANDFSITRPKDNILLNSQINSIRQHPSLDQLYIGTETQGLINFSLSDQSVVNYATENKLHEKTIRSIIFDREINLWIGTTSGIYKIGQDQNVSSFNKDDGTASSEITENSAAMDNQGNLYFGTPRGITTFKPAEIKPSSQMVSPILREMKVSGKSLEITPDGPLFSNLNLQDEITLKHHQNSISIIFDAIGYTNPEKFKFQWKLEGFDNEWITPTNNKEAIFSNLAPGRYTFMLKVSNDDQLWQPSIKTLSIIILSPFWKTTYAYILYTILLGGIMLSIVRFYRILLLKRNMQEKQDFFISVAHDLRTPLTLLKLPVEKMMQQVDEEQAPDQNLQIMKKNIDRLTNMVNQLLDFQKSDLKKMKLQVERIDLMEHLKRIVSYFEPIKNEKGITTIFEIDQSNTYTVWVDLPKFEKIIFNILSNAYKYTPNQGRIEIVVKENNKSYAIEITDNGEGIPKDQQKHIFQNFYRASNAINSQETGSGVGLLLSKQLAELHHGQISFTSEFKKGSTFTVTLLKGDKHFAPEEIKTAGQPKSKTNLPCHSEENKAHHSNLPKLLIIEDNTDIINLIESELQSNYKIYKAANGGEGIEIAYTISPDIILSDIMMPELNGFQVCARLKRDIRTCHIPIILMTALSSKEYKADSLDLGADAYIEKPFEMELLKAQLNNLINNRNLLKKKFLVPASNLEDVSPSNTDQEFLTKIRNYILENLDAQELSVESTAASIGISRPVLYRKIKSLTNLSPQQFILIIKLKEAARIMKHDHKNISETAYMTGFSDPKYFSMLFKKQFGITPSQFLKDTSNPTTDSQPNT